MAIRGAMFLSRVYAPSQTADVRDYLVHPGEVISIWDTATENPGSWDGWYRTNDEVLRFDVAGVTLPDVRFLVGEWLHPLTDGSDFLVARRNWRFDLGDLIPLIEGRLGRVIEPATDVVTFDATDVLTRFKRKVDGGAMFMKSAADAPLEDASRDPANGALVL